MRLFVFILVFLGFALPVQAQDNPAPEPTRIEINSESGEIHFYIEGELEAVLKSDGLHVRENVQFGGTIFDSGNDFHFSTVTPEEGDQDETP